MKRLALLLCLCCTLAKGQSTGALFLQTSVNGAPTVATPTFSPVAGTYVGTQNVTISSTTGSATLCYTTNGSNPTANGAGTCTSGTTYSTPVSVASSLTLKAIGSKAGFQDSAVGSAAYVISAGAPPFVQQCSNYANFSASQCTLTGVAAGHTLIIGFTTLTGTVTSMTDSCGSDTPALQDTQNNAALGANTYSYIVNNTTSGNCTIHATLSAGDTAKTWLSVAEYSGAAVSAIDGHNKGNCESACPSTISSANFTTANAVDRIWAFCFLASGGTPTAGTAPVTFTARTSPSGSGGDALVEDGSTSSAGTYFGQCGQVGGTVGSIVSLAIHQ